MADIKELQDPSELEGVVTSDGMAIVEATAEENEDSKDLAPVIDKLAKKYADARWCRFDAKVSGSIVAGMKDALGEAPTLPVFCIYEGGVARESVSGATEGALEEAIQRHYKGKIAEE